MCSQKECPTKFETPWLQEIPFSKELTDNYCALGLLFESKFVISLYQTPSQQKWNLTIDWTRITFLQCSPLSGNPYTCTDDTECKQPCSGSRSQRGSHFDNRPAHTCNIINRTAPIFSYLVQYICHCLIRKIFSNPEQRCVNNNAAISFH